MRTSGFPIEHHSRRTVLSRATREPSSRSARRRARSSSDCVTHFEGLLRSMEDMTMKQVSRNLARARSIGVLSFLILCAGARIATAAPIDVQTGRAVGVVTDPSGRPLAQAMVTLYTDVP